MSEKRSPNGIETFSRMPPKEKLAFVSGKPEGQVVGGTSVLSLKGIAVKEIFEMDPTARAAERFGIVAIVDPFHIAKQSLEAVKDTSTYAIRIFFPGENDPYVEIDRYSLGYAFIRDGHPSSIELKYIDSLVENAGELQPETFEDRQQRIQKEVQIHRRLREN